MNLGNRSSRLAPRSASEASQESSPHTPCEEPPPSTRPRAAWTGFACLEKPRLSCSPHPQRGTAATSKESASTPPAPKPAPSKPTPHSAPCVENPCAAAPPAKPTANSGAAPPTPMAKAPKSPKPRPSRPPPKIQSTRPTHPHLRDTFFTPRPIRPKSPLVENNAFYIRLSLRLHLSHLQ
jgi:hypothetical protein